MSPILIRACPGSYIGTFEGKVDHMERSLKDTVTKEVVKDVAKLYPNVKSKTFEPNKNFKIPNEPYEPEKVKELK